MKNVALLGGSFNPVHSGHIFVANSVLELMSKIEQVWLVPTYVHMFGKEKLYIKNRIKLLKAIETDKIKLFTYEIDNKLRGGTYAVMKKLSSDSKYKNIKFYIIIGSDCVLEFEKWKNYERLAQEFPFIIVPRVGYDLDKYKGILSRRPHVILEKVQTIDYSSTEVREKMKNKQSISDLVPESVEEKLK